MLTFFKRKADTDTPKKQICITGILAGILRPGTPALYLYRGELIRTSIVQAILETAPDYVRFETLNGQKWRSTACGPQSASTFRQNLRQG